ncbi:MAG: hypothetical protein IPK80_19175 [Nannocystis sp.]|nr:hypothetical protein [Nannocystis sp.]
MKIKLQPENRDAIVLSISLDRDEVRLVDTHFGVIVSVDEFAAAGEPGGPALPEKTLRVALPPGAQVAKVSVERSKAVELRGPGTLVAPVQEAALARREVPAAVRELAKKTGLPPSTFMPIEKPLVRPPPTRTITPPNPELYKRALTEPQPLARLIAAPMIGMTPIATIRVAPIQLDAESRLSLVTNLVVRIAYEVPTESRLEVAHRLARRVGRVFQPKVPFRAQAKRSIDLASAIVINRDWIPRYDLPLAESDAEYLIITDNQRWDAATKTPVGPVAGDMVAAFTRLRDWKRARGLSAEVVTITEIVAGYGAGALDLQEAIRNYLKHAHARLGAAWVLLGGDVSVVPVRSVVGHSWGGLGAVADAKPADGNVSWSGSYMRVHWSRAAELTALVRSDTGAVIPRRSGGSGDGWYYVTSDTYATASAAPTAFVRIDGAAAAINGPIMAVVSDNTIPTDLYYASLVGSSYGLPGRRDWDLLGNGLYGQHNASSTLDGVSYQADVSVGRAPAGSAAQADAFVDKVIAYERGMTRSGAPLGANDLSRVVYAASNWGGRAWIGAAGPTIANGQFQAIAGQDATRIQLASTPANYPFHLLAHVSDTDIRELPYSTSGRGFYFTNGANSTTVSEFVYYGQAIPIPTRWIIVRGDAAERAPQGYILDDRGADGSMADTEALRMTIEAEFSFHGDTRLYEDEIDLASGGAEHLTVDRLRAALDQGPHFVCLSGHGNWNGCCGLDNGVAAGLNNDALFIAYADSCLTNRFDVEDAMSEALVNNPHGGAVAYVGNTRYSWVGVGDNFERGFFRRLAEVKRLGLAFDVRCAMLTEATGFHQHYNPWAIFAANLLGDPEMKVWRKPKLIFPHWEVIEVLPWRKPIWWKIPEDLVGDPLLLEELQVTLRQGDHVERANVDAEGKVLLDATKFKPGELEVTVSGTDFAPKIQRVKVK